MTRNQRVVAWIDKARDILGWNVSQVETYCHIRRRTIDRMRKDSTNPQIPTVIALAHGFGADIDRAISYADGRSPEMPLHGPNGAIGSPPKNPSDLLLDSLRNFAALPPMQRLAMWERLSDGEKESIKQAADIRPLSDVRHQKFAAMSSRGGSDPPR